MNRKSFLKALCAGAASIAAACRRPAPTPKASPSPTRAEQLVERIIEHNIATLMVGATYIGDRLGLFRAMAGAGPLAAEQLASKAGVNPRYTLEWLRTMASSSYIDYHPASGAFELPAEHAAVLVDEESPLFCAGIPEGTVADILMVPRLLSAVRGGKGIPYSDYPAETFDSIERTSKPEYRHLLTQQWLPAVPGVVDRLRAGGSAADLGSGAGLASIAIARAFPSARAFGFEPYAPSVARASQNARDAGVAARVQFSTFDGVHVPRGPFDLITINYALHHAGDPVGLLSSARQALAPRAALLIVEFRKSARLEDDIGTIRRLAYGYGLLECLPTALAEGGPGYGTGITEPDVRQLADRAGFRDFTRILPDDPMRAFFVLRA